MLEALAARLLSLALLAATTLQVPMVEIQHSELLRLHLEVEGRQRLIPTIQQTTASRLLENLCYGEGSKQAPQMQRR